jgi:hypothetical protein
MRLILSRQAAQEGLSKEGTEMPSYRESVRRLCGLFHFWPSAETLYCVNSLACQKKQPALELFVKTPAPAAKECMSNLEIEPAAELQ